MKLRRTDLLPFVFTNERGQYVYEDGSPITWKPMDKPTDRAPMLSDAQTTDMLMMEHHRRGGMNNLEATRFIRDFYDAKITSGELRVVKKVSNIDIHGTDTFRCSGCDRSYLWRMSPDFNFCPGCGAEIIKA